VISSQREREHCLSDNSGGYCAFKPHSGLKRHVELDAKLPSPLDRLATFLIKIIPPNRIFGIINNAYYRYHIKNKIFKFPHDSHKGPRVWKENN
jgi:hypothetical protein